MIYLKFLEAGGWPFVLDDLNQVQLGWINQATLRGALLSTSTDEIITLTGVTIDTSIGFVTEGVVQWDGRCYPVQSHSYTLPGVGEVAYWEYIESSLGGAGDKVFQDSSSHSVYFSAEFRVSSGASVPSGAIPIENTVTAADRLREVLSNQSWHLFASPNSDVFYGPGMTPDAVMRRYFKTLDGFVHLKGEFTINDITVPTNLTVGNLPIGYRPPHDMSYTVFSGTSSPTSFNVRIEAGGNIIILGATGYHQFNLNNIPAFSIKS